LIISISQSAAAAKGRQLAAASRLSRDEMDDEEDEDSDDEVCTHIICIYTYAYSYICLYLHIYIHRYIDTYLMSDQHMMYTHIRRMKVMRMIMRKGKMMMKAPPLTMSI
jgi:hypothetical protein